VYYEEKCVDGVWYWRGTPTGEWNKFSYLALQEKLNEVLAAQQGEGGGA